MLDLKVRPDVVNISHVLTEPDHDLIATVHRQGDGLMIYANDPRVVRDWLIRNGYEWVPGSNGVWRRDVRSADQRP